MKKRPKDGPFGALAALRGTVRESAPTNSASGGNADEPPVAASTDDDLSAFRQAVADASPLALDDHVHIERPRPSPVPRPRPEIVKPETPAHRRPLDPNDAAALFNEAMTGVAPLADTGRVEIGRKPRLAPPRARPISHGMPPAIDQTGDAGVVLPPLPDGEHDPATLFRRAIGEAAPLPDRQRATLERMPPPPHPRQREEDDAAVLRESVAAPLSFEDRIDIGDEGVHLRDGLPRRVLTDLRRGRWVVQAELDLHGLTRDSARHALGHFLHDALESGLRCVRLIHGKGLGSPGREPVLKHLSRGWLMQREEILAFCQARPHDGGEGALLILLRNPNRANR